MIMYQSSGHSNGHQCNIPYWTKSQCSHYMFNRAISQSRNALVPYPTMLHSEQKCTHFYSEWSIVGYGTDAFWDLLIRSILVCSNLAYFEITFTHSTTKGPFLYPIRHLIVRSCWDWGARLLFKVFWLLWNLGGIFAAQQLRCLPNFKVTSVSWYLNFTCKIFR